LLQRAALGNAWRNAGAWGFKRQIHAKLTAVEAFFLTSSLREGPMAEISQADAKQYDRQIRLWGAQAQQRLSESRVLLIGISSLGAEVAKNIVLAGIKSLCIFDPTLVSSKDSSNIFLFRPTDHGSRVSDQICLPFLGVSHADISERY
jgi:hypothetical protein